VASLGFPLLLLNEDFLELGDAPNFLLVPKLAQSRHHCLQLQVEWTPAVGRPLLGCLIIVILVGLDLEAIHSIHAAVVVGVCK